MRVTRGLLLTAGFVLVAGPALAVPAGTLGACRADWEQDFPVLVSSQQSVSVCIDDVTVEDCEALKVAEPTMDVNFHPFDTCENVGPPKGEWDGACLFYDDIVEKNACGLIGVEPGDYDAEFFCEWEEGLEGRYGASCAAVPALPDDGMWLLALLVGTIGVFVVLRMRPWATR